MSGDDQDDIVIDLPQDYVTNSYGFALDIGGSVLKLAYRSKTDYANGKPLRDFGQYKDGQIKGLLHLLILPRDRIDLLVDFILKHCDTTPRDGESTVNTTGFGGNFFRDKIQEDLKIRTENKFETECFIRTIRIMWKIRTAEELLLPLPEKAIINGRRQLTGLPRLTHPTEEENGPSQPHSQLLDGLSIHDNNNQGLPIYPAHYITCGSAFGVIQVEADGTYKIIDGLWQGGKSFLGLTRMLTGVETYEDMLALAEKGTGQSVDRYGVDVRDSYEGYSALSDDSPVCPFGKAAKTPKGKLRPEDLALSTLRMICHDLVNLVALNAYRNNVRSVFFFGNFVNSQLARDLITENFTIKSGQCPKGKKPINFQFLKNGGHLAVVGTYIYDSVKSPSQSGR